jgi:hypothetical protein
MTTVTRRRPAARNQASQRAFTAELPVINRPIELEASLVFLLLAAANSFHAQTRSIKVFDAAFATPRRNGGFGISGELGGGRPLEKLGSEPCRPHLLHECGIDKAKQTSPGSF